MQTAAATTEQVVSIYIYMIYMVVSVYWLLCMVCVFVCVCVCDTKSEYYQETTLWARHQ